MSQDKTNSGTPHLSTDDLINDYLNDMFGQQSVPVTKVDDLVHEVSVDSKSDLSQSIENTSAANTKASTSRNNELGVTLVEKTCPDSVIDVFGGNRVSTIEVISSDLSLVPTIKLIRDENDKGYRSQCEAQIILLTFLFYLRKPLSPRVRKSFLDFSEQAIDDYYAAFWLAESAAESLQ